MNMTNLNTLNTLLVAAGKKPLKVWKGSKAALEARIAMFAAEKPEHDAAKLTDPLPTGVLPPAVAELKKKIAKAKAKETTAIKEATMYTLADLARAANVNPKVARAKLRRHAKTEKWLKRDTWTFDATEKKKVEELLAGTK
jgi:hypothetical protein